MRFGGELGVASVRDLVAQVAWPLHGGDIAIECTGIRAGERVHEDLFGPEETIAATAHPKILRASRPPIDAAWLDEELAELERLVEAGDTLEVVAKLG